MSDSLRAQSSPTTSDDNGSPGPSTASRAADVPDPEDLRRQLSLGSSGETERRRSEQEQAANEAAGTTIHSFKQQSLPGWKPLYKFESVYWKCLLLGLIYIPVGILLTLASRGLTEIVVPYTDCISMEDGTQTCADVIQASPGSTCTCQVEFNITQDIDSQPYMYYALTNFHQNHRMYVRSKDDNQMLGKLGTKDNLKSPDKNCEPHAYRDEPDSNGNIIRKRVIPCGAIANSLFNDSITICRLEGPDCLPLALKRTGIAWDSDKDYKFKNPNFFEERDNPIWENFTHPHDWSRTMWDLDPDNPENNGLQNEDFIVWMRTAALSNFRKPYRIFNEDKLLKGTYRLLINYSYQTKSFRGTKSIVICTHSPFMGSKNTFLGISFSVVGGVSIITALLFLYFYISKDRNRSQQSRRYWRHFRTRFMYHDQRKEQWTRRKIIVFGIMAYILLAIVLVATVSLEDIHSMMSPPN